MHHRETNFKKQILGREGHYPQALIRPPLGTCGSRVHFVLHTFLTLPAPMISATEIIQTKRIGVTSLAFQGHVTSSVT